MKVHRQRERRFGPKVVPKLRGTIQADIFKEVQAQNETIFPIEASLHFLTDMVEFTAWKLRAIGKRSGQDVWRKNMLAGQAGEVRPKTMREVYRQEKSRLETLAVYGMADLGAGARVAGPCLIEAETFTAYLKDGHDGEVDRYGNLVVTVA